jgi:hypothetical protein
MNYSAEFNNLEENIETTVFEGLLKLGYQDNESIRIYYDLDLLNHLLCTSFASNEDCLGHLKEFQVYVKERFQNIQILLVRNRFEFIIPTEALAYIYKKNENNLFLKEIIKTVNSHDFTLQDILGIFERYSKDYICEELDNSEFQYVLYFKDGKPDKFKYCFSFDEMGGYYHRLLDFSYNKIMQE